MKLSLLPLSALAAVTLLAPAAPASAQTIFGTDWRQNNYVQGNLGAVFDGNTHLRAVGTDAGKDAAGLSPGIFGSVLVGHELGRGFAIEGEGLYAQSDIHSSHPNGFFARGESRSNETYGGLVNLKYEVPTPYRVGRFGVAPYVAAGVGYGGVGYDVAGADERDDGLIWQAKAGLAIPVSPRLTWDVGYRYLNGPQYEPSGDASVLGDLNASTHQHIVSIGARWKF